MLLINPPPRAHDGQNRVDRERPLGRLLGGALKKREEAY